MKKITAIATAAIALFTPASVFAGNEGASLVKNQRKEVRLTIKIKDGQAKCGEILADYGLMAMVEGRECFLERGNIVLKIPVEQGEEGKE